MQTLFQVFHQVSRLSLAIYLDWHQQVKEVGGSVQAGEQLDLKYAIQVTSATAAIGRCFGSADPTTIRLTIPA